MFLDLTSTPVPPGIVTAAALIATTIGLLALLRSGHWLTTLLFSSSFLSLAAFEAGTLALLHADSPVAAHTWASYLGFVSALTSWLWLSLSVVLARPDPWLQIRNAAAYLTLALLGCVAMAMVARSSWIVRDVTGTGNGAAIWLGPMGKIYLLYLVLVMVAVLMNLERMLRTAPASAQHWLRPLFLSFLVAILSELVVVSGGLMTGGVRLSWMAASAAPLFGSASVAALALARRRLSDMSVPVARPVIYYSSVSLTLAVAFLLAMAVFSRVLPGLPPLWKQIAGLGFTVLVVGGGLVLTFSPAASRAVRRFIDRNFYANRYDYRREWERVSGAIVPTARPEDVCRQIESLVCAVFDAERVAIYLRDEREGPFHRVHGPSALPPSIPFDNPLVRTLETERRPLVFRELALDLDLMPVAVENRPIVQALAAEVVAPLSSGDELVGMLWVSEKRTDEEFTAEDVEFLAAMSRQLAAALWFARLAEQLAETRQLESLHRLSSYVLHDIKNHVSGLSLVVENARRHMANPDFQRDAMTVVERTVTSLKELMTQVAGMGRPAPVQAEPCSVRQLLDEAATASGLSRADRNGVTLRMATQGPATLMLDRRLMLRVLVNLLTNAREALSEGGEIEVVALSEPGPGTAPGRLTLQVRDSGRGMTEEFIRTSLFRPFATTKPSGLGVGLSQCKSIVEAHGGTISVESRPGVGTTFCVRVPARVASEVPENAT